LVFKEEVSNTDMKILLLDIDSKIPNLALKKVEKYHLDRGDEVIWNNKLWYGQVDKTYLSVIFTWNKYKAEQFNKAEKGGTGWDIKKKLPEEIENIKVYINWGFTSRGCIRKCAFCFVPEKEGTIHSVGDIYDIWDGKSKTITLMDNNILALKQHFKKICSQIRKEKLKVDFNQGLDIRLLDEELLQELKTLSHFEYKFAWDNEEDLEGKFRWIKEKLGRCTIFVICGFPKDNFEEVVNKFHLLRKIGHNGYAMRHENFYKDKRYIKLARWVNQHHIFHPFTFKEFIERDKQYHNDFIKINEVANDIQL